MARLGTTSILEVRPLRDFLSRYPFSAASYLFIALACGSAALLWPYDSNLIIFPAAMLWGWSEIDGRCGRAHICSITFFHNADKSGRSWRNAIFAYTVCGSFTAFLVGYIVGSAGSFLPLSSTTWAAIIVAGSSILLLRELGPLEFPLPQVNRQTHKSWAVIFGSTIGAGMWGGHIGLAFATVVNHSGFYALILIAAASTPTIAAMLFVVYWVGRTLPIWMAPRLRRGATDNSSHAADEIVDQGTVFRHVAASGLVLSILGLSSTFLR